jgi:hypothetical protein
MSKIQFEYDKKYNFIVKGSLLSSKKKFTQHDFTLQIQGIIITYKKLYESYIKAFRNDGKIIGVERADIISQNDLLINTLILMIVYLRGNESLHIITLDSTHPGFVCTLTVQSDLWNANGRMSPDMVISFDSLYTFMTESLNPKVSSFLMKYKKAAEDNILEAHEKKELDHEIKHMITTSIHLRFLLSHCLINS